MERVQLRAPHPVVPQRKTGGEDGFTPASVPTACRPQMPPTLTRQAQPFVRQDNAHDGDDHRTRREQERRRRAKELPQRAQHDRRKHAPSLLRARLQTHQPALHARPAELRVCGREHAARPLEHQDLEKRAAHEEHER
eukprot:914774-Prymnesium_polylepis.3